MAGLAELLGGVGDGRKTGIIKIRLPEGAGPLSGIPALGGKNVADLGNRVKGNHLNFAAFI